MLDKNVLDRENTTANVVYRHLLLTIVIQSYTTIRRPKVNGALVYMYMYCFERDKKAL
jgi:hypothetical protein